MDESNDEIRMTNDETSFFGIPQHDVSSFVIQFRHYED